jgi:acyl carrier protein
MPEASADEVYRFVQGTISQVCLVGVDAITEASELKDIPEWDSLKLVEIVLAIEQRFGISLPSKDVDRLQTVSELHAVVRRQVESKAR